MRRPETAHGRGTHVRSFVLFALLVGLMVGCGRGRPTAPDAGPAQPDGGNKNPTRAGDKSTDAGPETVEDTLKALAGSWRVVSIQNRPFGYTPSVEKVTAQIEGKTLVLTPGISFLDRAEIVLDPTTSPKQFDLQLIDREGKPLIRKSFVTGGGKLEEIVRPHDRVRGIYRLQGDQLTLALSDRDNFRPTEFRPSVMENTGTWATVGQKSATYVVVVELTRGKADPEPAPTGPKTDKQVAESVVVPMLKAMKAGDYDAALRETDVPFLGGVTGAQKRIETAEGV
ncbi:MAG TPA: TIGR03067 domain-containing protein, partial [Urbifossiella sp.]|nr:TIGR03067 domain-containing protein [Urbifossiella sp.]